MSESPSAYEYIYICMYIFYIYILIYIYIYVCIYICVYVYIYIYMCIRICIYIYMYKYMFMCTVCCFFWTETNHTYTLCHWSLKSCHCINLAYRINIARGNGPRVWRLSSKCHFCTTLRLRHVFLLYFGGRRFGMDVASSFFNHRMAPQLQPLCQKLYASRRISIPCQDCSPLVRSCARPEEIAYRP